MLKSISMPPMSPIQALIADVKRGVGFVNSQPYLSMVPMPGRAGSARIRGGAYIDSLDLVLGVGSAGYAVGFAEIFYPVAGSIETLRFHSIYALRHFIMCLQMEQDFDKADDMTLQYMEDMVGLCL